jgi:hypothetical protein
MVRAAVSIADPHYEVISPVKASQSDKIKGDLVWMRKRKFWSPARFAMAFLILIILMIVMDGGTQYFVVAVEPIKGI